VEADDGVQVIINGQTVIDSMQDATAGVQRLTSSALTLTQDVLVPIVINYYQATGDAIIALHWNHPGVSAGPGTPGHHVHIPSANLFHRVSDTPITGVSTLLTARHTPQMATSLQQSDSSTYLHNSLTINWVAPADMGCLAISHYSVQATLVSSPAEADWVDIATSASVASSPTVP
jgi:hypothetical protein